VLDVLPSLASQRFPEAQCANAATLTKLLAERDLEIEVMREVAAKNW
jgi:hypothetical protein